VSPPSALVFGASGGLARALADQFLLSGWKVDLVSRASRAEGVTERFAEEIAAGRVRVLTVQQRYAEFVPVRPYRAYAFAQALFDPLPLAEMTDERIEAEIAVGLTDIIRLTRTLLNSQPLSMDERRDFAFIGSTSAYAGFKNTAVYCAVKHGLLGFVRAMNDEYGSTQGRFWLFSMGTMNTDMGARLVEQDPSTFLKVEDVAARIVSSVISTSNLFEPEVVMRRREIRFLPKPPAQ
jgi:NAD(P)-dependent dehydrogenase (short-subunit alcohol dehydrogenase family)